MIADWLTAIGTMLAVVVALLLAIFHEHLRTLLWRPKLEIVVENRPPDCHLTTVTNTQTGFQAPCYYFRFRVENKGKTSAETVEAYIEEVLERRADGKFEKMAAFLPLNLVWSHFRNVYFPSIPPGVSKFCDFGHIVDPSARSQFPGEDHPAVTLTDLHLIIFSLDLAVRPATGTYLIPPGLYRFVIVAVASNAALVRRTIELNLEGHWFSREQEMLHRGVGMKLL